MTNRKQADLMLKAHEKRKQQAKHRKAAEVLRKKIEAAAVKYAREILESAELRTPTEWAELTGDYASLMLQFLQNKKSGRKAETLRDMCVIEVVWRLASVGVRPTRNREQTLFESGCSIAAKVFTERGRPLEERAAEEIWQRFMKSVRNNPA